MRDQQPVRELLTFIDASPSPWHVVATCQEWLYRFGFHALEEAEKWSLQAGGRYFVTRDDSSIIAFVVGQKSLVDTGFKIIGSHTDSPGLRIKPNLTNGMDGWMRLGVEIYGGPILATFSDRDLSLAGRISYRTAEGLVESCLVRFNEPLVRLPNLAIHMNRMVNEEGLKFQKQTELPLLLTHCVNQQLPRNYFENSLKTAANLQDVEILAWELNVYDTQKGSFWGAEQEFYANSQIDNLASCHAGMTALLSESVLHSQNTVVVACFDHEEVGSCSSKGAEGRFLPDTLERISLAIGNNFEEYKRTLARSFMVSADMAHAYHPNFPSAYEPEHKVMVNQGPVIKVNVNQRYASESVSIAQFCRWCELVDVPYQMYTHRSDLACGSTIGPIAAANVGIRTVDVGSPMWAMHSLRESAGVLDHVYMIKVLQAFFIE